MNCRDITSILDNHKGGLDPARRQQAEAHVASCADCASAWNLQVGLAELPGMAMPANFASHCRLLVAATPATVARHPAISHRAFWGSLAAMAAAAAMLLFIPRQSDVLETSASARPSAVVTDSAPLVPEAKPVVDLPAGLPQPAVTEAPTPRPFLVRVMRPDSEEQASDSNPASPPSALDNQIRAYKSEYSRKQAADAFHDAMIRELQLIPGLRLVDSDLAKLEPDSSRKYQIQVRMATMVGYDEKLVVDSRYVPMSVWAQQIRPTGNSELKYVASPIIDLLTPCTGTGKPADDTCPDPQGAASTVVRKLREQLFPPDPMAVRALQAKLRDPLLDLAQRSKSLFDLLKLQENADDQSLLRNPGVVRAAIDMAATADPALRARIWRAMRGNGSRDLISPLMNSLLNDPVDVRLAALEALADFTDDPRVRGTLQSIAQGDSLPLVRAVAQRSLSGEGPWKQYVVASLKDSTRPAAQRVEALTYYLYPPGPGASLSSHPDTWKILQELDDDAVAALAQAFPNAGSLNGTANNFLGNFAGTHLKSPVVTDMLLNILANDARPFMRGVAAETLGRALVKVPRVREALDKAVQSDPDPRLRDNLRQILEAADRR